jgi:hypothetical protein
MKESTMSDLSGFARIYLGDNLADMAEVLAALQSAGVVLYEVRHDGRDWVAYTWRGAA